MNDFENFEELKNRVKNINMPPKKLYFIVFLVIIVLSFFFTGLYIINPDEVGVIQRLGKFTQLTQPGLHFKIPFQVDKLTKVKITKVFTEEFGYRTVSSGVVSKFSNKNYEDEYLMLTGDLNIAEVEWVVQYNIKNPVDFLFNIRDVRSSLKNLSESVMRQIVGDRSVDETIVLSREEIGLLAKENLQKELDKYNSGINIVLVKLQNVNPPVPVRPAFNEVNSAKQEAEKTVNEAEREYNMIIPRAKGRAKQTLEKAKGYYINRINRAKGDAEKFVSIYNEYSKAKEITKKRIYLEIMQQVLPNLKKVYIVDPQNKSLLPLLNLSESEVKK